jgi:hypothetical protein
MILNPFCSSFQSTGDVDLEWIGFSTNPNPSLDHVAFLTGKRSVYRAVPNSVLAAATQLDKNRIQHWLEEQPESYITKREKVTGGVFGRLEEVVGIVQPE